MRGVLFSLFLIFMFFACTKEQPVPPIVTPPDPKDTTIVPIDTHIIELGKSTMLKNGILWSPPVKANFFYNRFDNFYLNYDILYANLRSETFSLEDIPCKPGKYAMEYSHYWNENNLVPQPQFLIVQDFDQLIGAYNLDTTRINNYVEVLKYDSITHIVEGRFQVFMGKDVTSNPWNVPDSIFLTDGKFHLKIVE